MGHEAAVWHVKQLSDGKVATASADKTIGIWNSTGKRINTLRGIFYFVSELNYNLFPYVIFTSTYRR